VVDVTDGGVHMEKAVVLTDMWQAAADFFRQQDQSWLLRIRPYGNIPRQGARLSS
jgi:hypothetical protein